MSFYRNEKIATFFAPRICLLIFSATLRNLHSNKHSKCLSSCLSSSTMATAYNPSKPLPTKSVLFVCLGNICRSPIAEAVFRHQVASRGIGDQWTADSCGTIDYHAGKSPDSRARKVIHDRGVQYEHKARLLKEQDFHKFDYILGMDRSNVSDLKRAKPEGAKAKIHMIGEFDRTAKTVRDVPDPYYDTENDQGFQDCFDQCWRACEGFINMVEKTV